MATTDRPIVMRQLVALMRRALGVEVRHGRVWRVARELAANSQIPAEAYQDDSYGPDEADKIEGGLRRLAAGWSQGRNVKGDFWGRVDVVGEWRLVRLPYARAWRQNLMAEETSIPDTIICWEWPTARVSGRLTRLADRGGYPTYKWEGTAGIDDDAAGIAESLAGDRSSPRGPGKVLPKSDP